MLPASRLPPSLAATDLKSSPTRTGSSRKPAPGSLRMSSSPDRLVYMANQIGKFFNTQGSEKTIAGVSEHIRKFWDPRMRKQIFAHLDAGGAGLDRDVREALERL